MTFTSGLRCKVFSMSGLILLLPGAPVAAPHQATAPQDASPAAQSFRISGTAVNAMTGAPLSQARISIAEIVDRGKITSMITSEDGHFVFSQRKAGKYSLQGAKRGFISAAYDQHEQFSTAIVTGPEFSTENLVLRLTPMAFITGHVFDEFGDRLQIDMHLNPAPALHLVFRIPEDQPDQTNNFRMPILQKHAFDSVEFAQTENMRRVGPGMYEVSGVPPGRYNVRIKNSSSGQLEQSTDLDLIHDGQELNDSRA